MNPQRSLVVFDLGGVLIDWNPRYLYRKLFRGDEAAMEEFLKTVCTPAWNLQQDGGRPFAQACAALREIHPRHGDLIDAWFARFDEMLGGDIGGTVEIFKELRARHVACYALSNWSAETYPLAFKRFDFLHWFRGIMLSGEEKLVKPDPRIFTAFLDRFGIDPQDAVFIDDSAANVKAARDLGFHGVVFTDAESLRTELVTLGLLDGLPAGSAHGSPPY